MKIIKTIVAIIIFICLTILYSKYIGTTGIQTREYRVESSILTNNFSGLKIVHFSDLLYGSITDMEDVKKMVDKINILKPDLVLFTGDLISPKYKLKEKDKEELIKNLKNIEVTIDKYAIYGDYDFDLNSYEDIITSSGFKLLSNEYEEVFYKTNESMYIVGLPSSIKTNIDMDKSFEFYTDENRKYTIVLVHDGKSIKYIDDSTYEVDLILGGHSLNGSVRLPFVGGILKNENTYKYKDEEYGRGITKIYISGGLGTDKYDFRLNNKPSFNLYRLKAQS